MQSLADILQGIVRRGRERERGYTPEPEPDEECPRCGGLGWVSRDVHYGHPDFGEAFPCKCNPPPGLGPERLSNYKTHRSRPDLEKALRLAVAWVRGQAKPILVFGGIPGVGKSHLAKGCRHHLLSQGADSRFLDDGTLVDMIHASFETGPGRLVDDLGKAPWLIIDDWGLSAATPAVEAIRERIINRRIEVADHPGHRTLIALNLEPDQLTARVASRLKDVRLVESFGINAPDFRAQPL